MADNLWGCAFNEMRSPYKTVGQTCSGTLHYRTSVYGICEGPYYVCDKHEAEDAEAREQGDQLEAEEYQHPLLPHEGVEYM